MVNDFFIVIQWWAAIFLIGIAAWPIARLLFDKWFDQGYFFAKAVGMATVTWVVYLLGTLRVMPFSVVSIGVGVGLVFLLGIVFHKPRQSRIKGWREVKIIAAEEVFFFAALLFWSYIKAHEPSIRSLEKFMDFGFVQSILTHPYFPTPDLWYAGHSINYYYFGHIVLAVLTKLSGLDLAYTFNLMLATIFALTATMSFAIGREILRIREIKGIWGIGAGMLTAFLVTLGGNLQTIYAFTKGYSGDHVVPFWQILWPISELWGKIGEGANRYWYANATRFIPFSIHEFPSYSFVVSDVHGHVLSLPFVLLAIGLLMGIMGEIRERSPGKAGVKEIGRLMFYGFLVAVLLMTNALDGPIYLGLFAVILAWGNRRDKGYWVDMGKKIALVLIVAAWTSLPFLIHFKSFVTGIGVNCPPAFLSNSKIGPFLFEGVEKCQRSPLWMLLVLWGFFLYCGGWYLGRLGILGKFGEKKEPLEKLLAIFFFFAIGLIIFPEFLYFKDIYPMHFRSNTMFKLGYQAFILFSIVSSYAIVSWLATSDKRPASPAGRQAIKRKIFFLFLAPLLFLVSIYPLFSVRSYFGELRNYDGLYGLNWLKQQYPDDYAAIGWLKNQSYQGNSTAVIVEADGDSYTDYNRFSVFTGLPTIVGWHVHEWLWRGSYDVVAPRSGEVSQIYESGDINLTKTLLSRYGVRYVIVGALERQKYKNLAEWKFASLGQIAFRSGETIVYFIK